MNTITLSTRQIERAAVNKERLVLTGDDGQPVAALIPLEDLDVLRDMEDRADLEEYRKAKMKAEQEGYATLDELLAENGMK